MSVPPRRPRATTSAPALNHDTHDDRAPRPFAGVDVTSVVSSWRDGPLQMRAIAV